MTTTKGLIYHMVEEEALDAIASTTEQINFIKTIRTLTKVEENVMLEGVRSKWNILLGKIQELEPVWIPVEERMPEEMKRVLAIDTTDTQWKLFRCDGEWLDEEGYEFECITHWMPLPQPPTKRAERSVSNEVPPNS